MAYDISKIKDRKWLLENGHGTLHYVKAFDGRRSVDVESGLYVCANCTDPLNQKCQAPHDHLCPCCRFEINGRAVVKQMQHA